MPNYIKKIYSSYTIEQIFNVVIDIEKYHEFLPWCKNCRILKKHNNQILAEMLIKFKTLSKLS